MPPLAGIILAGVGVGVASTLADPEVDGSFAQAEITSMANNTNIVKTVFI
ncbi:MAG: hypothetical protein BroJett011_13810 [Chloroflexota bacterium]|nr:MAG: hypothetical protein BroJett011_13810 [Chloroflexota bacterium]